MKLTTEVAKIFVPCAALLLCFATSVWGQQNGPTLPAPDASALSTATASTSVEMPDPAKGLISIDVSVTDKTGKPVTGLSEKDLSFFDNERQQKIVTFQAFDGRTVQPANSLETILVIDELNPLPGNEAAGESVRRDVERFLQANGGVLQRPTMIYRLAEDGLFKVPYATMDGNELALELEQPAQQRRIWSPSTIASDIRLSVKVRGASHEAVTTSTRAARDADDSLVALGSIAIEERRRPGRKLMFWLGNGWSVENGKAAGLSEFSIELLTRMREARIRLWSALEAYDLSGVATPPTEVGNEPQADLTRVLASDAKRMLAQENNRELVEGPKLDSSDLRYLSLPVIAMRSGGGILDPTADLAARLGERVREESSYYSLTFDPPRTEVVDEYRHLKIEIDRPDLTAHVFEDYYDEPVFYDQAPAKQSLSVKQLQALMASGHDGSDAKLEHQLSGIRLTERLSSTKLEALEKLTHGKKSRAALRILADKSAFFTPPDDEIIAAPPPEATASQQMVSKVVSYINSTIPHLPDFLATRTSVQYYELPQEDEDASERNLQLILGGSRPVIPNSRSTANEGVTTWKTARADQSLHEADTTIASIRFRQGKELVQNETVKNAHGREGRQDLRTVGAFGPILGTIMFALTSPHSQLNWDHWERGDNGQLAVFRYHVTQGTSFFSAGFCCLPVDDKRVPFLEDVPFHGVIAVDATTGAIMRLTVQSDLGWRLPLQRSDLMVEYGPVAAGLKTYICPTRSVSLSRQRRIAALHEWGETFKVYGPFETVLNEMRFDNYHIFGSTSRILPGYVETPEK